MLIDYLYYQPHALLSDCICPVLEVLSHKFDNLLIEKGDW